MASVFEKSRIRSGRPRVPDQVKFADFAPDADPLTPGALLDVDNLYPTLKGYRTYPGLVKYSSNNLPSACLGAFSGLQGSTQVLVAGTATDLYLLAGMAFTPQSLTITGNPNGRWRFDLYGNDLLATNGVDPIQVYTGTGTFGALGGSPPLASVVQASDYSLFLIEPNSNIWHSSLSDILWTNSIATQTVSGALDSTRGNITAAHALRSGMGLYKRKALHYSTFSGPPFYWDFAKISMEIGAPTQEAVANLGDIHYFPGPDDFYSFDGYTLSRVPNSLKEWFFETLDQNYDYQIAARWDQEKSLVFWHFPSIAASPQGSLDSWICLNIRTGKWSKGSASIDIPVFTAIQTGNLTYAAFKATYATYGAIGNLLYGDLRSRTTDVSGVIKKSDHGLYLYNGQPGEASHVTNDFGDRHSKYQVTQVRPQYTIRPEQGATLTPLNQEKPGSTPVAGTPVALSSSEDKFDVMNTARLQRFLHVGHSEYEITGIETDISFAGER